MLSILQAEPASLNNLNRRTPPGAQAWWGSTFVLATFGVSCLYLRTKESHEQTPMYWLEQ